MKLALLFGGRGKETKKPASYRPAFLALEDRESPSGLFSGLSADGLLDGTSAALDPLGLERAQAERSVRAALHRETGASDAGQAGAGQDQSDMDVAGRRWSSVNLGTTEFGQGPRLRTDELLAPTDMQAIQPYLGRREVDLSWNYQGTAARSADVYRSCDGGLHFTKIVHLDYPTHVYQDMTVRLGQTCTYGVRAENSTAVSAITYSDPVTIG